MNETLKGVAHIGAELAAAKADLQREMERHRKTWRQLEQVTGLLREIEDEALLDNSTAARIQIALSQQTEQQPVCWASSASLAKLQNGRNNSPCVLTDGPAEFNDTPLYAAPIAQTAPQPEQSGVPGASAKWAKYDTSWVVDYLRDETNFDADAIGEMLEFARRAALSATPSPKENGHE